MLKVLCSLHIKYSMFTFASMSTQMIQSSYGPVSQIDFTNGKVQLARNVEWYQPVLNTLPETARRVFRDYSGVSEDGIVDHIYQVRDKAWDM